MRVFVLRSQSHLDRLVRFLTETWGPQAESEAPLEVTVGVWKGRRADWQNRAYWGFVLAPIAEQVVVKGRRYDVESWHEMLKRMFIGYRELPTGGMVGISTTTLSGEEFDAYMTEIRAYAGREFGVVFQERGDFFRGDEDGEGQEGQGPSGGSDQARVAGD